MHRTIKGIPSIGWKKKWVLVDNFKPNTPLNQNEYWKEKYANVIKLLKVEKLEMLRLMFLNTVFLRNLLTVS